MPLLHRSITESKEPELVSHVLNDVHHRDTLFNIKGMRTSDARVLECVDGGWYTYDGADSLLRSQIASAISPVGLDPTIGLMEFEWVQPMDRPPFELGTYGGHLRNLADTTAQPPELTEWLRTLPSPVIAPRSRRLAAEIR